MRTPLAYLGISLLAACGGTEQMEGATAPDAGEMSPDAGMDAEQQPLDHSCSLETGRASILAVLHNADGSIKSTAMTDASGKASWDECPADALISYASQDQNMGWHGATIASVQPGDHFEVMLEDSDIKTHVLVSIPSDGADVSYIRAQAGGGCYIASTEGATADVKLSSDCMRGAGAVPVLATGKIGSVPVYSYGSAAAMVEGGETIVNNMSTWMTGPQVSLSASNIPGSGVAFYATASLGSRAYGGTATPKTAVGGSASAVMPIAPSGFTTTRRVSVATSTSSARGFARETSAFEVSFDMNNLLPELEGISVDDSNPARPKIGVVGSPSAADVGLIFLDWTSNDVPVQWRLMYRASTANVFSFPELPAQFTGGAPVSLDALRLVAFDVTGSTYADVLTRGYHFYEHNHDCPALPAGLECSFTSYQAN